MFWNNQEYVSVRSGQVIALCNDPYPDIMSG
jgi:hypothetical protein